MSSEHPAAQEMESDADHGVGVDAPDNEPESTEGELPTPKQQEADEATYRELANLSRGDFDRIRKAEAKRMGITLKTLEYEVTARRKISSGGGDDSLEFVKDPKPWDDPVDGADLADDLRRAFLNYMVMPDHTAEAAALWVLHAHAHDAARVSPILAALSPEKRCGKSNLISVLSVLVPRALPSSNITSASLFRVVEAWSPTLLIDEGDTFVHDNNELRGILNSGHNRMTAVVIRTVGDTHEPKKFGTWAPKVIAMIGKLPDTLADRAITVHLRRKRPNEVVEQIQIGRLDWPQQLCRQAARWSHDNMDVLRGAEPEVPKELHDRAADNWRAMIAIADCLGGEWPKIARRAAIALSAEDTDDSIRIMLLADVRAIFQETQIDRISSAQLVAKLVAMEDRPWPEIRGKPITARGVASRLAPFKIAPGSIRLSSGETPKGYTFQQFDEAFGTYLPPEKTPQRHNPQKIRGNGQSVSATKGVGVADRKTPKPASSNDCGVVAVKPLQEGGKDEWGDQF